MCLNPQITAVDRVYAILRISSLPIKLQYFDKRLQHQSYRVLGISDSIGPKSIEWLPIEIQYFNKRL
jgi:hypothetical protein